MGIDITTTVGVGFRVEHEEAFEFFVNREDYNEDYSLEEHLYSYLLAHYPLLSVAVGGNLMSEEPDYVISVKRLEDSWDSLEFEGGIFGFDVPELALDERIQLMDVAAAVLGREPKVAQFVAVCVS